jgi:hypothetical protein
MDRVSIQQFRAALADPANPSGAVRAYREIARRSRTAPRLATGEWIPWGAAAAGWAAWPDAGTASTRDPGARFAAWGDWSAPPAVSHAA